jgi:transglutaminase/protease-like cytokinesis protein 3
VHRNIPVEEQSKWQLLPKPLTFDEYKNKPYLRPEFFKQKLKLTSKKDCILVAQNGLCNIEYTIPLTEANAINFTSFGSLTSKETFSCLIPLLIMIT